ncbi:class I SAM-dependent methyltransferase family protein [Thermoplasma sp.]|uniref:class I SAM-dependent methyltransferase n=1 Tax=Thermoplasma sp. TaxID=1973142 RepID=UPI001278A086|nr:class I SAM-dependent methyltransferase family protein [Thermoplasma sp.]KAA8923087.1 MAG: class I SAM-dependent methyltransferase family protein [Thermoplasma sp.]
MPPKKFVRVRKQLAERTIRELKNGGLYDRDYGIIRDGDFVFIPVVENYIGDHVVLDAEPNRISSAASGSFDIIGSIAIMKKQDETLARNILNTHRNIRSVFYDEGVDGPERIRKLKLIAGDNISVTEYRENGCTFIVDVARAYFSPRLATERRRLIEQVSDGEFIFDMFAGIGPISIEIARYRMVRIIAVDMNCDAIDMLQRNMARNPLRGTIEPLCEDARNAAVRVSDADRVIMNHPTASFEFIDSALKTIRVGGIVNYYEFLDDSTVDRRISDLESRSLQLLEMHRVHSYSKTISLYSMTLRKARGNADH